MPHYHLFPGDQAIKFPSEKYSMAHGLLLNKDSHFTGTAIVPFDTENRPDILAICKMCEHPFADHNIYCSKCPKYQHEFLIEVPGQWWLSATDLWLLRTMKFRRCDVCKAEINCKWTTDPRGRKVVSRYGTWHVSRKTYIQRDYYIGTSDGCFLYYWGADGHYCLNCARKALGGFKVYKCTKDNSWLAMANYYAPSHPPKVEEEALVFNDILPKESWRRA